jgi:hypothetical protein
MTFLGNSFRIQFWLLILLQGYMFFLQHSISGKVEALLYTNRRYPIYRSVGDIMFLVRLQDVWWKQFQRILEVFSLICCSHPVTSLISARKFNSPLLNRLDIDQLGLESDVQNYFSWVLYASLLRFWLEVWLCICSPFAFELDAKFPELY